MQKTWTGHNQSSATGHRLTQIGVKGGAIALADVFVYVDQRHDVEWPALDRFGQIADRKLSAGLAAKKSFGGFDVFGTYVDAHRA